MRRIASILLVVVLLAIPTSGFAACGGGGPSLFCSDHITTQTTTVITPAVAGKTVAFLGGSLCVDANGANTGLALQDTAGTNTLGANMVYVVAPGTCFWFQIRSKPWGNVTAPGTGLQVVTTVGSGPVNVYVEVVQQ